MTTPENGSDAPKADQAINPTRARRPAPDRLGPRRSQTGAAPPPAEDVSPMASPKDPRATLEDVVSQTVRMGYDVITDNLRQGRQAAERFRQGEYRITEAPGDLETAGLRLLQLAREVSSTTFDICEKLIKELGSSVAAPDQTQANPPFRPVVKSTSSTSPTPTSAVVLKLDIRFQGSAKATGRTPALSRPQHPALAAEISADPLAARDPAVPPITGVSFHSDLAIEGLVCVVTIPVGQAPGVYSGLVFARNQDLPLGVLTVEIAP